MITGDVPSEFSLPSSSTITQETEIKISAESEGGFRLPERGPRSGKEETVERLEEAGGKASFRFCGVKHAPLSGTPGPRATGTPSESRLRAESLHRGPGKSHGW